MTLRLIATGGTFDKRYDAIAGNLDFDRTHLAEIVARVRMAGPVSIQPLMQIDSLDMTDSHRQRVTEACRAAPEARIVIVHGTDTMVETASVIAAAALGKTVVLTGAMVPYDVRGSDALFNLGFAIGVCRLLDPGIWIAMQGAVFPWDQVRKNREAGRFEAI